MLNLNLTLEDCLITALLSKLRILKPMKSVIAISLMFDLISNNSLNSF